MEPTKDKTKEQLYKFVLDHISNLIDTAGTQTVLDDYFVNSISLVIRDYFSETFGINISKLENVTKKETRVNSSTDNHIKSIKSLFFTYKDASKDIEYEVELYNWRIWEITKIHPIINATLGNWVNLKGQSRNTLYLPEDIKKHINLVFMAD